ncbi:MAG: hypothetical protein ACREIP_03530, partial [Alphaproteobacteria bacterium]
NMRIRELKEIRYEEQVGNLKISGLNPFKKTKSVNISIDDPEAFLNAIKSALQDSDGKVFTFGAD